MFVPRARTLRGVCLLVAGWRAAPIWVQRVRFARWKRWPAGHGSNKCASRPYWLPGCGRPLVRRLLAAGRVQLAPGSNSSRPESPASASTPPATEDTSRSLRRGGALGLQRLSHLKRREALQARSTHARRTPSLRAAETTSHRGRGCRANGTKGTRTRAFCQHQHGQVDDGGSRRRPAPQYK